MSIPWICADLIPRARTIAAGLVMVTPKPFSYGSKCPPYSADLFRGEIDHPLGVWERQVPHMLSNFSTETVPQFGDIYFHRDVDANFFYGHLIRCFSCRLIPHWIRLPTLIPILTFYYLTPGLSDPPRSLFGPCGLLLLNGTLIRQ